MSDRENPNQHLRSDSFLSKATVIFVRLFGSWGSIILHTIFFGGWFYLKFDLEPLLILVSLEAIYIGIFILMAENVETQQRDHLRESQRQRDMAIVKQDARVDEKSLKELKQIKKQISSLQNIIQEKL